MAKRPPSLSGPSRRLVLKSGIGAVLSAAAPTTAGAAPRRTILNDASRLNPTPVARHRIASPDTQALFVQQLRSELKEAAAARRPVAVSGARHSMGGQSLPLNGTAITDNRESCIPDREGGTVRVDAGTRWRQVIATLDPVGFSPAVLQSNSDFAVGSTFCVNAHGWPVPYGPFGATVRSARVMLADGSILTCSRTENPELFGLATGGYGLYGIVLDLDVEMVPNRLLAPHFQRVRGDELGKAFVRELETGSGIVMAYGRLSVARDTLFDEALLVTYRGHPRQDGEVPAVTSGGLRSALAREIYRAQIGWETGKRARWFLETVASPAIANGAVSRNALLYEPVSDLAGHDGRRTDILHEYFVPPERFAEFVAACRPLIARSDQELLNVTLRYVGADDVSVLAYAPSSRIAAVMSFSQALTPEAEASMTLLTEELIDRVLALGGTFYLPYRLHARFDQVERGYPRLREALARKRHYDPGLLFRNRMWDAYFAGA